MPTPQGLPAIRHNASSTTATADMPTGIVEGEMLVAQVLSLSDWLVAPTSNHGYTIVGIPQGNAVINFSIWGKVAGASETAATWSHGTAGINSVALFRVDTHGSAWDDETSQLNSAASASTLVVPEITTDVNDELLVVFEADSLNGTFSTISGMTEFYDGASTGRTLGMCYEARASAGATGSRTITPSAATRIIGLMAAIKPATVTAGMVPI